MFYVGVIIISILGAALHFVYELSGHNKVVAVFAAVNESTWEHIKIGMTATIIWSLYDGFVYGLNPNYLVAKSMCLLTIILLIPLLFYSYSIFTKKSILIVDIICFCITIYCSQYIFYHYINISNLPFIYSYLGAILLFFEMFAYLTLTYNPFENFIFRDPISHKFGLEGHTDKHQHIHRKHKELIIILICLILLSGCFRSKKEISKIVEVDVKECAIENENMYKNTGMSEHFVLLDCSKLDEDDFTSNWKPLPLPSEITEALSVQNCDEDECINAFEKYNIPQINNGYYFFVDNHKSAEDKYSSIPLNDRSNYNFNLAIYEMESKQMYYYELEN